MLTVVCGFYKLSVIRVLSSVTVLLTVSGSKQLQNSKKEHVSILEEKDSVPFGEVIYI